MTYSSPSFLHRLASPTGWQTARSSLGLAALLVTIAACSSKQHDAQGDTLATANDDAGSGTSNGTLSHPQAGAAGAINGDTADAGTGANSTGANPSAANPDTDTDTDPSNPSQDPDTDPVPAGGGDNPPLGQLDAGVQPELPLGPVGGPAITTTPADQKFDLFGSAGHRFWINVRPTQLGYMNDAAENGEASDRYVPEIGPTFADHVVIQDAQTLSVADYGKVEAWLIGSSTRRPWTSATIPNIRLDANEFQKGLKIGTFEHIRLNNGLAGGMFRELLTNRIYRALGYPAVRGTPVFLGSNAWGEDVWVPMTAMEVYKKRFCHDNAELIGGGESCLNMWEFAGDPGNGLDSLPMNHCQLSECDDTRLEELSTALASTPVEADFKQALDPYVSWDHFHRFQCLSWMLWTGDDPIHNLNNNLIIEREDGRLVWAPYSVDVSLGQSWHQNTPLTGFSRMAKGCQADAECWADMVLECGVLIDQFDALNPELFLDEAVAQLQSLGMLREGDLEDAAEVREWLVERQQTLPAQLEHWRYLQNSTGDCDEDLTACNDGTCNEDCD